MAHSILRHNGNTVILNDLDLLVIIWLANRAILESPSLQALQGLRKEWESEFQRYGPGVIDLKLDELVQTSEQQELVRQLLDKIRVMVSKYQEAIPAEVLNAQIAVRGITFGDFRVSFITEGLKKLQNLFAGDNRSRLINEK